MGLRLLFFTAFFIGAFINAEAQNYPYLNASTGNENAFAVDADSNVYLFFGNRLEKRDKNFTPIWINSYGNLKFKNILLTKTGSIYFIATDSMFYDKLGKVNANGTLNWCKSIPIYILSSIPINWNAQQLLLDRNNQLIITGCTSPENFMLFLKIDSLGAIIKQKILRGNQFLQRNYLM